MPGKRYRCGLAVLLLAWTSGSVARAQENTAGEPPENTVTATTEEPAPAAEAAPATGYDFWTADYMLGDWNGLRTELKDAGVDMKFRLMAIPQFSMYGGRNTDESFESSFQMGYAFDFDMEKLVGIKGGSWFMRFRQTWNGGEPGLRVHVGTSPYSGVGARSTREFYVDKYHWRQRFFDDRLELRLGILDAADYFDLNEYADSVYGAFPNGDLEHNPTVPLTLGGGAFMRVWPTDWLSFSAGAVDPDRINTRNRHGTGGWHSAFHDRAAYVGFWEVDFIPSEIEGSKLLPGTYRIGWWYNPDSMEVFQDNWNGTRAPRTRSGDVGWYLSFDQMVWKENPADPKDSQGIGLFARYGYAHEDINEINHFWSLGGQYKGLIPERNKDILGFGVAQRVPSDNLQAIDPTVDPQTVYDLYYKIIVTPWLKVTPDFQWISNPGSDRTVDDAFVGAVRVEVSL